MPQTDLSSPQPGITLPCRVDDINGSGGQVSLYHAVWMISMVAVARSASLYHAVWMISMVAVARLV